MADENGTIGTETIPLHQEMEDSFMQFALSVIVARALPDARDGLKPSQRRILLAMYMRASSPTALTSSALHRRRDHEDLPPAW